MRGAAFALVLLVGCGKSAPPTDDPDAAPPWASATVAEAPRPGMAWIPEGEVVIGTPSGEWPRAADAELPGVTMRLGGFHIDLYPHPNEAGAIPTSAVSRDEAQALCAEKGKRLCSELELEQACKGPRQERYLWGPSYQKEACATGVRRISPNGYNAGCKSGYGVFDLVGSVATWTSSPWGRGTEGLVTVRGGGGGPLGEITSRCAWGRGLAPTAKPTDVGVRCCAGPENPAIVELPVTRGTPLRYRPDDTVWQARVVASLEHVASLAEGPVVAGEPTREVAAFRVERIWVWHPLGNEELLLGGGCAASVVPKRCGVVVGRAVEDRFSPMAFVSTERWQPTIGEADDARTVLVMGGDLHGAFRKRVSYDWGRIGIGEPERKKKRGKGKRPSFD